MLQKVGAVVLCILDGWGHRQEHSFNAIAQGNTPFWDFLLRTFSFSFLKTSGSHVGLPEGQMGNSEVGHMTLGAGRLIVQELVKISSAFQDGSLKKNPFLLEIFDTLKKKKKKLHFIGLLSDAGVHSHQNHLFSLLEIAHENNVESYIHVILDGRDSLPKSALKYVNELEISLPASSQIATCGGRYFAMDRDNRWERTQSAFDAIARGISAASFRNLTEYVETFYAQNYTDEFMPYSTQSDYPGIQEGESILFFNFRSDRMRQLVHCFVDADFKKFTRPPINLSDIISLTSYSKTLDPFLKILCPREPLKNFLGEVISTHNRKQLRIAETEKYAHVTFFFNGGIEAPFQGEERILIPSPCVPTYNLKPQMSAFEVTEAAIEHMKHYDLTIINYANADMVGHTGNYPATLEAVHVIDQCLEKLTTAVQEMQGCLLITADHGNCEQMIYGDQPYTAHTTNDVYAILVHEDSTLKLQSGSLQNIAPTILDLMGIVPPKEMTANSLLQRF